MANKQGHGARGFSPLARKAQLEALTAKESLFVEEYLVDTDQTKAAIRAGYSVPSAATIACQLMKKPKINAAIMEAKQARSEATGIDARFLLTHLAEMLKADIGDIVDDTGAYKPIHQWPKIWRQMLSGMDVEHEYSYEKPDDDTKRANGIKLKSDSKYDKVRVEIGRVIKLKFVDRLRVIELIGRHIDIKAFEAVAAEQSHTHIHLHSMGTERLRERYEELSARVKDQLARQTAIEAKAEVVR